MKNFTIREDDRETLITYSDLMSKWAQKRALALVLAEAGIPAKSISRALDVAETSVYTWIRIYLKNGLGPLIGRHYPR